MREIGASASASGTETRTPAEGGIVMTLIRRSLAASAALVLALAIPFGTVVGSTTVAYGVRGIEIHATATQGTFSGVAWAADDFGTWTAVVQHTAFDAERNSTITGGTFALDGRARDASGTFTSGSVSFTSADPGCGREFFGVEGAMTLGDGGTGTFSATLVHYRTQLFGRCITYWATIRGITELTLA
jgi:hypothetical protein